MILENSIFQGLFWKFIKLFCQRVPEITDQFYPIDDAMRTGYVWDFGPLNIGI